ncbi:MAG: type I DNA topoisomerase [Kiritimatiellae bacterium]|nr:type I DNA topoisomerase [Kiritimatiellia bacterium]
MGKKLLIVESPAKAKTIGKYLGNEFVVKSSVGHIRDLPKESNAITIKPEGEGKWRFEPRYVISEGKQKVVSELKAAMKSASEVYLASDPDREGEAIAWHLKEVLEPVAGGKPFRRVTYNEITKSAVKKAVEEPRDIDMPRVDAQQARRILDRLVGYKVSPLLWKYIQCPNNRTLSAGRVQSVALRLIVERQREIDAFTPETYYLLGVEAKKRGSAEEPFTAKLSRYDGEKPKVGDRQSADNMLLDLAGAHLEVTDIKRQPKTRHALPPFTTSTLQQAASSVLGMSPGKTMKLAQSLYEQGRITYMRTDSVNISEQARGAAKDFIVANYGEKFYPEKPNLFKSRETAQGAHEAIRPTDILDTPEKAGLDTPEQRLYGLVWARFVASQMADANTTLKTVSLEPRKPALAHSYVFTASATEIDFEGFLKVMKISLRKRKVAADDDAQDEESDEVQKLPNLSQGEELDAARWLADAKQTKGPAHYSEASLIKALEENGVGRPSTYAQTIETLKAREYAKTEKRKLVPLERGKLVSDWLTKKLDSLFNVGYTAEMEAELDKVEEKGESMDVMLSDFYSKFVKELAACAEPAPDRAMFDEVFKLLGNVKTWKEPKKVGKRVYDDKAFVESVREQADKGEKALSSRQLEFLVRMALVYADQIPGVEKKLKELGLAGNAVVRGEKADPEMVNYCFELMDRIGGMNKNPFLKSLREQVDHGRGLSPKQLSILARAVGENAGSLPDCEEVREKLSEFVPGGFTTMPSDPAVPEILEMMKSVAEWRPPLKKGRKTYDDKGFVDSLSTQFARRHSLSPRQTMALKRVAVAYKAQIPNFDERAEALGLVNIPSSDEKKAEVLDGIDEAKS